MISGLRFNHPHNMSECPAATLRTWTTTRRPCNLSHAGGNPEPAGGKTVNQLTLGRVAKWKQELGPGSPHTKYQRRSNSRAHTSRPVCHRGYLMLQPNCPIKARLRVSQPLCLLVFCLMLLALGCSSGTTRKASSVKSAKNVTSSAPELSSRNQSLLALYSAEVEVAADRIISEAPSPVARRRGLVWKAEAIPVLQASLLNTDPVAALLDTWAFIFQMAAFMDQAAAKQDLGEFHSVVAETLKSMDSEMEQIVLAGAPTANVADLRQKVIAWAAAHPIRVSLAGRQSADAALIRKVGYTDLGTMASIKALSESLGDLTARLDSYNAYLPKQARWQAELLLQDITREPQVNAALANFATLSDTAAKAASSMEHMPEVIGQTRVAVRADVEGQRLAMQDFFRQERLETIHAMQQERIATLGALSSERLAATSDLRNERQIVLSAFRDDQEAVMSDIKADSEKAVQDMEASGRRLVDHFFLRAFELMLLMIMFGSLVAWILLKQFAGGRPERDERLRDRAA